MAFFEYQAKDVEGKIINDKIEADDQAAALAVLSNKGYLITSINKLSKYPKYSEKRMLKSWELLCKEEKFNSLFVRSNVGKSLVVNFCPKYAFRNLKIDKNKLFCSKYSSKHPLEGYENLNSIPKLREKYLHKNSSVIKVKHHSPEKMLAICSLGKVYCSKTTIDKESENLAKFLKLKIKRV